MILQWTKFKLLPNSFFKALINVAAFFQGGVRVLRRFFSFASFLALIFAWCAIEGGADYMRWPFSMVREWVCVGVSVSVSEGLSECGCVSVGEDESASNWIVRGCELGWVRGLPFVPRWVWSADENLFFDFKYVYRVISFAISLLSLLLCDFCCWGY